jgi:hypothetical protein
MLLAIAAWAHGGGQVLPGQVIEQPQQVVFRLGREANPVFHFFRAVRTAFGVALRACASLFPSFSSTASAAWRNSGAMRSEGRVAVFISGSLRCKCDA